ncbi:MAG TPA: hypothetical protein VF648_02265 [Pyrinomonadaceae bacterium]|jgi:hypothetical protein
MTETSQIEEMKRYLFQEMTENERETLEERFFEDPDFFYDLLERENDLIDSYVRNELTGKDLIRFEKSLTISPNLRAKIADAQALQTLIVEEKPVTKMVPAASFWLRFADFFTFKMSALQFAISALAILLVSATGFLLYQNWQTKQELAKLQNEQNQRLIEKENSLQEQLNRAQEREQDLRRQIESQRGQNETINEQSENQQSEILRLQQELQKTRQERNRLPRENAKEIAPPKPILASAFLQPTIITRSVGEAEIIPINSSVKSVRLSLQIPAESNSETFSVNLDNATISENLKPRRTKSGRRVLDVILPVQKLGEDRHILTIGTNNYIFRLQRK